MREFFKCFLVFVQLYRAGFRIHNSKFEKAYDNSGFYRFFWGDVPANGLADIDYWQDAFGDLHYSTMLNGHTEKLS